MDLIGWYLIVPLALASLLTGIAMSVGTPWGLFRHYWVLVSLVLTIVATAVLLKHMPTVSAFARAAAEPNIADVGQLRGALWGEVFHAGVGLLVLFAIEVLNVYKPQGMTAFGRSRVRQGPLARRSATDARPRPAWGSITGAPRWAQVIGFHAIGLAALFVILHLAGAGLRHH